MKKGIVFYFFLLFLYSTGSFGSVTLIMKNHDAAPSTQVTVPVKVKDFLNIISVQGTIQFDQSITTFVSVQDFGLPGMNASSFGTSQTGNGKLTFSWFDASLVGVSLPDSAIIFSIKLNVIGSIGQVSILSFVNAPTIMEVVNNTFATETLVLQDGAVNVQNTYTPASVTLKIDTISGTHGSQVLVSLRGVDFTNINSIQGTIQFDPAVVSYGGIGYYGLPDLSSSNFGTTQISSGKLTFSWVDATLTGQDMTNDAPLFTMIYNLTGNAGDQSILSFATAPTPLEVTDSLLNTLTVSTVNGKISITGSTFTQTLRLRIDSVSGPNASQVVVPVRVWEFNKIISMQGTISFNTITATFASVEQFGLAGMDASSFGTSQINNGKLMFSWVDPTLSGQNLADSTVVFAIRYNIVGFPGNFTPLDFINTPTPIEFIDTTFIPINSILESGKIRVSGVMTITTNNPAIFLFCTGDSVSISYIAFGAFNTGNDFILQLSDASGSFTSPTIVSTLNSITSGTFNDIIPLSITNGNGYRFRVISTNPSITGTENGTDITIFQSPSIPTIPVGVSILCSNFVNSTYTTNIASGATSYIWTINPSVAGTLTPSDTSADVDWDNTFFGNVQVFISASNSTCQSINSDTLNISIFALPEVPAKPFGDSVLCASSANSTYSTYQVSNSDTYEWQLSPVSAGTITGTDTSAVVDWNPSFSGAATIIVRGLNANCSGSYSVIRTVNILLTPTIPVLLTGDTMLCVNPANSTYIYSSSANATSYVWSLITSGAGALLPADTTAIIDWNNIFAGTAQINFTATNGTCSSFDSLIVTINSVPLNTSSIIGQDSVCDGSSVIYSVAPDSTITSYTWSLPVGWSGTSITDSINVTTNNTGGTITVTANNNCGSSTPESLNVSIISVPAQPNTIVGLTNVCEGNNLIYNIDSVPGTTSYTWTLPMGWAGNSITDSITTTSGNISGNITVSAENSCGSSPVQTISVVVNPLPVMPSIIYGNTSICENSTQIYHIDLVSGATSYIWSIPSTWAGSSSTDSISIIPDYNSGNIIVYAINACGGGAAQQLWVTVQLPPTQPTLSWADTIICDSSYVNYGVIFDLNVDSFTWTLPLNWTGTSTNSNMSAFAATNSGQVTVVENNSCGIGPPLIINVTLNPLPIVTLAPFGVICDTLSVFNLTGGSPYGGIYSGTGVYNDSLFDPSISGSGLFTISYVFTDINSCANDAVADIQVDICLNISPSIISTNEFEIFPNPFSSQITVIINKTNKNKIEILNVLGEIVFSSEIKDNNTIIDLSRLVKGVYFVKINNGQNSRKQKLVKE